MSMRFNTKLLTILLLLAGCMPTLGQKPVDVVNAFGKNISIWCEKNLEVYRSNAENYVANECRVADNLMMEFAKENRDPKYLPKNYFNGFKRLILKERGLVFTLTNTREIPSDAVANAGKNEKLLKECQFVAGDIQLSGSLSFEAKDLYIIHDDKIVKIQNYEEVVDEKTGDTKVKVDFSDIKLDGRYAGLSYQYAKNFPLGFEMTYNFEDSWFMLGLDYGFNLDKKLVYNQSYDMKSIINFNKRAIAIDPKEYVTLAPYVCMKYLAVGCGFGALAYDEYDASYSYNAEPQYGTTSSGSKYYYRTTTINDGTINSKEKYKFMIRPDIKGLIPLDDETFIITINLGYDYVFGLKDFNGVHVGVGIMLDLNEFF